MNESAWETFLAEYSRELVSYEPIVESVPREVIKACWLGYSGAKEEDVAATEQR